jgi:DNA-binding response OmpR family regulator
MALIAVIDDDSDILEASSLILRSGGYQVITADNPDDGYRIVHESKPELIILDVMMDGPNDGILLARRFRKENILDPILMYSSVSKSVYFENDRDEALGIDEFVEKPISPEELIGKVNLLLKRKSII